VSKESKFVSRAGVKLDHALDVFALDVTGYVCADLGCNAGGFTDCLLQRGAAKVYAVDTGYGMLDYKLRRDPRVIVMERTNAMHVNLPEPIDLVVIDVAWTKQKHILPSAKRMLKEGGEGFPSAGRIVTLIKPHYEADPKLLIGGVLPEEQLDGVVAGVEGEIAALGLARIGLTRSPIKGGNGNVEMLALLGVEIGR
jgi:23S rRNA (cytidine1920-2'-O)/16S rRNA (cytidine1409-2'-O)-methyltransferase